MSKDTKFQKDVIDFAFSIIKFTGADKWQSNKPSQYDVNVMHEAIKLIDNYLTDNMKKII